MAVSESVGRDSGDAELTSSPETRSQGFVAVNNGSSSGMSGSEPSSRLSSPQDNKLRRASENSSHSQTITVHPRVVHSHGEPGHKRKRSGSEDAPIQGDQRTDQDSPSKRPEAQHMANRALRVLGDSEHDGSTIHVNGHGPENGHHWPPPLAKPVHSQSPVNGNVHSTSDAQMAEALQRETSNLDSRSRSWDSDPNGIGEEIHERWVNDPSSTITVIGAKRKRNFSNRTKTGCMTCRRRKKKCDETHPVCLNCTKGGFACQGYSMTRGLWQAKPTPVKPPVRLESKIESHSDVSEPSAYKHDRPADASPNSARPSTHYESGQPRALPINEAENQRQQHFAPSPVHNETRNRAPYPGPPQPQSQPQPQPQPQQWPQQQSQASYTAEQLPSLSELGRPEGNSNPPSRDMSRPPTQGTSHPSHPPPPSHQAQRSPQTPHSGHQPPGPPPPPSAAYQPHSHPPPPPPPSQGPPPPQYSYVPPPLHSEPRHPYHPPLADLHTPSHMRMSSASYDSHKSTTRTFNKEDVERSKMLRHSAYNHFDPTLEDDRKRCQQALKRFNQAAELDSGVSADEQRNILIKVFDPTKDVTHRFLAPPQEKGMLSHGVRIEAPFKCTYGYNIKIMDNVYIGSGCKIDDAGKVDIGPRTWIGPDVTIVTTGVSEEMIDRKGSGGSWKATTVSIASEVVIGEGAKIYPGVTIGRGATVEPFALVKESLGEYERQCADQGPRKR